MSRESSRWKSRMYLGSGAVLLWLLSGCSTTGGRDSVSGDFFDPFGIPDAVPKAEPKSKYGNPESYVVFGKRYYTKGSSKGYVERGLASWYGKKFHGQRTSSGERYDMYAMTAAHKTLPLPTYARVTNVTNGRSAVVKINDRGPFHGNRIIDLSYSAARKLGVVAKGTAMVEIRAIDPRRRESDQQNSFLASADGSFGARSAAHTRSVATGKTSPAKKPAASAKEAPSQVAKIEQPDTDTKDASVRTAKTTRSTAPESKVAVIRIEERPKAAVGSAMYLQVGAFGNRVNAEQLRRRLVDNIAEQAQVRMIDDRTIGLYRVRVGPFDSRKRATDLSQRLVALGLEGSHIVVE